VKGRPPVNLANLRLPDHWSRMEKAFVLFVRELVERSLDRDDRGRAMTSRRFLMGLRVHLRSREESIDSRKFAEESGLLERISSSDVPDCFEIGESGIRLVRKGLRRSVRRAADDLAAMMIPVFVHGSPDGRLGFLWQKLKTRWRRVVERRRSQRLRQLFGE